MAPAAITIRLDVETAKAYNSATGSDQKKMQALLLLWLRDLATADSSTLKEVMTDLAEKAAARGLTPEILESLLKEA